MPDNYYSEFNENGVVTPLRDLAAFPRSEQAVLGAKNLLPMTIDKLKSSNTLGTWTNNTYVFAGCTFECIVKNGIVTQINVSGTATTNINFTLYNVASDDEVFIGKRITMTGCPNTGSLSSYYLNGYRLGVADGSGGTVQDVGNGITFDFLNNGSGTKGWIAISIANGQAIPNAVIFKPMLRLASDTDPTYAPYAMTNKELTNVVSLFSNLDFSKTAYNQGTYTDLNNITTSGMYSVFTSVLNKPSDITFVANGILIVNANPIVSQVSQMLVACNTGTIYTREKSDQGVWSDWRKFTSTVVS